MNPYESKQEARRERLEARAARARAESSAAFEGVRKIADGIPLGQPILVGHHSEARARRDVERIDRGMRRGVEGAKEAEALARAADAVGTGGISSDDPDAVAKLREELVALEAAHVIDKVRNKATPGSVPGYRLTNRSANMRRIRGRIADLEKRAADVTTEREIGGARVVDDVEANRLRIYFANDARPTSEQLEGLKGHGFRWTPSEGCWQRHRSPGASFWAERICGAADPCTNGCPGDDGDCSGSCWRERS